MTSAAETQAPLPITEAVLKVVSPCNLACDYCYEYIDDSWREQPPLMPMATVQRAAERLGEHAVNNELLGMRVILHGGEPLMFGAKRIDETATILRETIPCPVDLGVQTNGTLLTPPMLEVLQKHGFKVGLSVDGNEQGNQHRLDHKGRSSYERTIRGAKLLREANMNWGILCVVDAQNDPIETYDTLAALEPNRMDFLLPHGNWSSPPPGRDRSDATPYADWLIPIFNKYLSTSPTHRIRMFDSIMAMFIGDRTQAESLGNRKPQELFVRPNGDYEEIDTLRSATPDAPATGMNVFEHSIDEVLANHEQLIFRRMGREALSVTCQVCPIVGVCGGGYIPHRYSQESSEGFIEGFQNPSVYSKDLFKLITYVQERQAKIMSVHKKTLGLFAI